MKTFKLPGLIARSQSSRPGNLSVFWALLLNQKQIAYACLSRTARLFVSLVWEVAKVCAVAREMTLAL